MCFSPNVIDLCIFFPARCNVRYNLFIVRLCDTLAFTYTVHTIQARASSWGIPDQVERGQCDEDCVQKSFNYSKRYKAAARTSQTVLMSMGNSPCSDIYSLKYYSSRLLLTPQTSWQYLHTHKATATERATAGFVP